MGTPGWAKMWYRDSYELGDYTGEVPGRPIFEYIPPSYACSADLDCAMERQPDPQDPNGLYVCETERCKHKFSDFEIEFIMPPRSIP